MPSNARAWVGVCVHVCMSEHVSPALGDRHVQVKETPAGGEGVVSSNCNHVTILADVAAMLPRAGTSQKALHHRPIRGEEPHPRAGFLQGLLLQCRKLLPRARQEIRNRCMCRPLGKATYGVHRYVSRLTQNKKDVASLAPHNCSNFILAARLMAGALSISLHWASVSP